ncbi:hypothetical protein HHI36_014027 [Cryptolaemus montrouzieri]|uniref:Uncharacterized protein n=1 Tax=Cryptolaemus montrouzieri TaxID=559131 RepID=A0ABD2N1J1_9CUCU
MSQDYIEETVFTLIKSFLLKYRLKSKVKTEGQEVKAVTRKENGNSSGEAATCSNGDMTRLKLWE